MVKIFYFFFFDIANYKNSSHIKSFKLFNADFNINFTSFDLYKKIKISISLLTKH